MKFDTFSEFACLITKIGRDFFVAIDIYFNASRIGLFLRSRAFSTAAIAFVFGVSLVGLSDFAIADSSSPSDNQGASNYYWCSGAGGVNGQFGSETSMAATCIVNGTPGVEIVGTPACAGWAGPYGQGDDEAACSATVRWWVPDYGGVPAHWASITWGATVSRCSMSPVYTKWSGTSCVGVFPKKTEGNVCRAGGPLGDPIFPATGTTQQTVSLPFAIGNTALELVYNQSPWIPVQENLAVETMSRPLIFGSLWQLNLFKALVAYRAAAVPGGVAAIEVQRGGNQWRSYEPNATGTLFTTADDLLDVVMPQGQGWLRVDGVNGNEEVYDSGGNLLATYSNRGGNITNSIQGGGYALTDQYGRSIQFISGSNGLIQSVTGPDGYSSQISYDGINNLKTVTWTDSGAFVQLNYADSHTWALTGVVDENHSQLSDGIQFATFDYDVDGRAVDTQLAGGVGHYSVTYSQPPFKSVSDLYDATVNAIWETSKWISPVSPSITLPNGQQSVLSIFDLNGSPAESGQTQPPGSGCTAATSAQTYDSTTSALTSYDDFDGNRTCYGIDQVRGLRLEILEGLPGGTSGKACPANLATYVPSPADSVHPERKTTTVWHPDWALKAQEAVPKKITTWVYNGQPDPIGGGTASCAPTAPALPDGKPIAVVCSRYEQATTDATGALGVSATVTGVARKWSYSYNQFGQVLTETAPKQSATDSLSHTTTYAYYADTSITSNVGHTIGDLQSVTNPLGQVTTFTSYDGAGRLLSSTDANGAVTTQTYWPRGWIKTQTLAPVVGAAQTTSYAYYPTGLLQTVTMPDNSMLNYAYDDAHRLTDVTDAAGNKIHYVLDNVGNRTSEQVTDASGNLASTVSRVFDALNRVQTQTGLIQ